MHIHAAVARAPHQPLTLETLTLDEVKGDEVLIELVGTGICHTDLAVMHQMMPVPLPYVLGHEGAGKVVRVGPDVTDLEAGDHVVLSFGSCGQCRNCRSGHPAYCVDFSALNYGGKRSDGSSTLTDHSGCHINGGFFCQSSFANYAIARRRNTVKVRKDAPLEWLGALGCGFQTGAGTVMNVLKPRPDSTLAIMGAGAVGFAALFAARHLGVERVIMVDRVTARLQLAQALGATHIIDTGHTDAATVFSDLGGLDYIVDTTGYAPLIETAVSHLNTCGTCALVGGSNERIMKLDTMAMLRGKTLCGVIEGDADPQTFIPHLVDLFLAGRFPIDRISRAYRFEDINTALKDTESGETIKPVLRFG